MENGQQFVDYYSLLQVNPSCDGKILEKAYRHFAQKYHPDHTDTADVSKFQEIIEAYRVLRDPGKRARYDQVYRVHRGDSNGHFSAGERHGVDGAAAIEDAEVHRAILFALYKRRREHADDPGVIAYTLQEMLGCSEENFQFHSWYLKSKGYVDITEQGTLAITIDGVDHVISSSRVAEAEKLLIPDSGMTEQ